jgi:hypothetical protein
MPGPLILETIDDAGEPLLVFVEHVTFVQRTQRRVIDTAGKRDVILEHAVVCFAVGSVTVPYSVEEFARKVASLT